MIPAAVEERVIKNIVIVGGGHAHVFVLKAFAERPVPGFSLTLIAKEVAAPYSGMLPGFVAGHYMLEECQIALEKLAARAGAKLIHAAVTNIDPQSRHVTLPGGENIRFDILSIDVGITPDMSGIAGAAEHALAVKPVSEFAPKWQALLAQALTQSGPRRMACVGGGAAGFELILAARHRLRTGAPAVGINPDAFSFTLIAGEKLLRDYNPRARRYAYAALKDAGVELIEDDLVLEIRDREIVLASGRRVAAGAVMMSTKAKAPDWFQETGLPLDAKGFLSLRNTLQIYGGDGIFAAGDCATVINDPRPKAGVFAVRQGPHLAENIRKVALGMPPIPFEQQKQFLTLLSLGAKRAIAARGPFAAQGNWVWFWKDHIDRAFMRKFQA